MEAILTEMFNVLNVSVYIQDIAKVWQLVWPSMEVILTEMFNVFFFNVSVYIQQNI